MMPVRRMKIKAAPNILGGNNKKIITPLCPRKKIVSSEKDVAKELYCNGAGKPDSLSNKNLQITSAYSHIPSSEDIQLISNNDKPEISCSFSAALVPEHKHIVVEEFDENADECLLEHSAKVSIASEKVPHIEETIAKQNYNDSYQVDDSYCVKQPNSCTIFKAEDNLLQDKRELLESYDNKNSCQDKYETDYVSAVESITDTSGNSRICEQNHPEISTCISNRYNGVRENNSKTLLATCKKQPRLGSRTRSPKVNLKLLNMVQQRKKKRDSKENIVNGSKIKPSTCISVSPSNVQKIKNEPTFISESASEEKRIFNERKQKYKQKLSEGNLQPDNITMFDLIFWNPSSNPMPCRDNNRTKSNSSSGETDFVTADAQEEQRVEDDGLCVQDDKIRDADAQDEISKENQQNVTEEAENADGEDAAPVLAPQVKIGPDGELIIDEKSLLIQTTAVKNRDKILSSTKVVEETNDSSHYGRWSKRRKRATEWTKKETARFYKALSTVGTDFSLMAKVFAWRSRSELKIKFKKEERINRHLIDTALNDCTQFDFSIFDESDYDPEEDRKESKEAEKAEAKRKKEEERQKRKQIREECRKKKKEAAESNKLRKRKLKEMFNKKKRKKRVKESITRIYLTPPVAEEDSNESTAPSIVIEAQEVICEVVVSKKDRSIISSDTFSENVCGSSDVAKCSTDGNCMRDDVVGTSLSSQKLLNRRKSDFTRGISLPSVAEQVNNATISDSELESKNLYCSEKSDGRLYVNKSNIPLNNSAAVIDRDSYVTHGNCSKENGAVEQSSSHVQIIDAADVATSGLINYPVMTPANLAASGQNSTEVTSSLENTISTADMTQISLPLSRIQRSPSGSQYVSINTHTGIKKVPIPAVSSSTSNVVIMASRDPQDNNEQIFHVYLVSPLNAEDKDTSSNHITNTS